MRLKTVNLTNVKSFRQRTSVVFHDRLNIFVGPNAGGKSNLLEILTVTLRHFFVRPFHFGGGPGMEQPRKDRTIQTSSPFENNVWSKLEKYVGADEASSIEITLEVDQHDIDQMRSIQSQRAHWESCLRGYRAAPYPDLAFLDAWKPDILTAGQQLNYSIKHAGALGPATNEARLFSDYLSKVELFLLLQREHGPVTLNTPYAYFSPYRMGDPGQLSVALATEDASGQLRAYQGATSRETMSLFKLAAVHFAEKQRRLESQARGAGFGAAWDSDSEVRLLTRYLDRVGHSWKLALLDEYKNSYSLVIENKETKLDLARASSGEREILNFVLGVFALGAQGGVVIIDEPELHLHPKWQRLLIELFEELPDVAATQLIVGTHSPSFITAGSVSSVARVFRKAGEGSSVVALTGGDELRARELLHIVNAQNNERMFFADNVLLVEGITDRLILERLLEITWEALEIQGVVEAVDVGGKDYLAKYKEFLEGMGVSSFIVADRDYLRDIGDEGIKRLFVTNWEGIDDNVLKNKKSTDLRALSERIDEAITSRDVALLEELWRYVKARHTKLPRELGAEAEGRVRAFIEAQRATGIYVLSNGEMEDYVPKDKRSPDGIIELTKPGNFRDWLIGTWTSPSTSELVGIALSVAGARGRAGEILDSLTKT